ncbi:MAG: hypothetical protein ACYDGS_09500 [Thermoleophilia bacterium]
MREATSSHGNLVARKAFPISIPSEEQVREIMDVKCEETVRDDQGQPAAAKVRPLVFSPSDRSYHGLGVYLGRAFSIGRQS